MNSLYTILETKIIAIMRNIPDIYIDPLMDAVYAAGIRAIEATFSNENYDTISIISRISERFGDKMAIGAGTVMTAEKVDQAHRAGASFIVSPNTDIAVVERTKELGLISIPGALTPTEIAYADSIGADIVKVFPAGLFGAQYFKAVLAPLSNIKLAAVANLKIEDIGGFKKAGAVAFGISSGIFDKDCIKLRDFNKIYEFAKKYLEAAR
ncbi:MAG: bifunctional 4-hydroxy-2-oxoglutarate aldolase/2-dehydro-3-deoxy-phosphogluconate aldolase [Clostridia bacterium]